MVIPVLRIFSEEKAKEFYIDYLGFTADWEHRFDDGMPLYMQVSSGKIVLHLSEHHGDASPGAAVRIQVDDLNAFHSRLSGKDYSYMNPGLEKKPWETIEMTVIDPFSNRIIFYEPA